MALHPTSLPVALKRSSLATARKCPGLAVALKRLGLAAVMERLIEVAVVPVLPPPSIKKLIRTAVAPVLLSVSAVTWAFPWDKDMVDQPSAKPQESEAPMDAAGVPVAGGETLPAPVTEAGMFEAKDAAVLLENPIPATPESVALGQYLYEINCMVCHGPEGRGDGPVGVLLATSPVDMNDAYTQDQGDGQLFFTITRGRVTMPYYRDALSVEERWHVINYMRATFRFPSQAVEPAAQAVEIGEQAGATGEQVGDVAAVGESGPQAAEIGEQAGASAEQVLVPVEQVGVSAAQTSAEETGE